MDRCSRARTSSPTRHDRDYIRRRRVTNEQTGRVRIRCSLTLQLPTTSAGANLPPRHRMHDPILILLVQIGLILGLSRVMGFLFARIRQPQVIGEMIAGLMLGPSLLGWAWPDLYVTVFPRESI